MVKTAPGKATPTTPKTAVSAGRSAGAAAVAEDSGGGPTKKPSSSSKKAETAVRTSTAAPPNSKTSGSSGNHAAAISARAEAGGAATGSSAGSEPSKITCTCPHLVDHPNRQDLLRKLVDVRIEVNTALILKEKKTVGVFGAMDGDGMGHPASMCHECDEHTLHEPDDVLTCLECGYTACGSPPRRHMLRHCLTQPGDGHCFAASRERAEIFCARCCDYVYDVEFDTAVSRVDDSFGLHTEWDNGGGWGAGGGSARDGDACVRGRRRRRARGDGFYRMAGGKATQQQQQQQQQPAGKERASPPAVLLSPARSRLVAAGVRGMFNLGNTCFMSSVLQAVLHISVMQSFFSEKGHEPARCEKLRKETTKLRSQILQYDSNASFENHPGAGGGGAGGGGKDGVGSEKMTIAKKIGEYCIACELARLFHDMFSTEAAAATLGDTEPYVPHRLLEAVWSASEFLAGYEQQDAHEFLIAVLDSLHGHLDRAARDESNAPVLRRTLAAHKLRAKQKQKKQEAAAAAAAVAATAAAARESKGQLPSQPAKKQQKQQQQPKKAGKQNGGGKSSGGTMEQPPPSAVAAAKGAKAAAKAAAGGGKGEGETAKNSRKRSRSTSSVAPAATASGWEGRPPLPGGRNSGDGHERGCAPPGHPSAIGWQGENGAQHPATSSWHPNGDSGGDMFAQSEHTNGFPASSSSFPSNRNAPPRATTDGGGGYNDGESVLIEDRWGGEEEEGAAARAKVGNATAKNGSMLNGQCLEDLNLAGFVQEVFAGVTRSDVVCTACGDVSCTYERFLEVSLPVRPGEHERRQQQQQQQQKEKLEQEKLEQEKRQEAEQTQGRVQENGAAGCSVLRSTARTENGGGVPAKAAAILRVADDVASAIEIPNSGGVGMTATSPSSASLSSLSSLSFSASSSIPLSVQGAPAPPANALRPATPTSSSAQPRQQQVDPSSGRSSPAGSCAGGGGNCKDNDPPPSEASQVTTPSTGRVSPASATFSDDGGGRFSSAAAAPALDAGEGRASPTRNQQQPTAAAVKEEKRRTSPSPRRAGGGRRGGSKSRSVATGPARSITDCFARFAARESLTVRMACDSCSAASVCKTKQMSFCSLPRVLVLHLKRFDAMADRKIDDFVSFPARGLDMGKYLTGWPAAAASSSAGGVASGASPSSSPPLDTETAKSAPPAPTPAAASAKAELSGDVPAPSLPYDLLAVVNHSGGMAKGHYTAFVKEIGRWFRFDDTWVHEVEEEEVLSSEAYILFYFQRGADAAWRPTPPAAATSGKRPLSVP
ncbi:unnamed protein product [Ectocarpus sp. 13 AM-2016]